MKYILIYLTEIIIQSENIKSKNFMKNQEFINKESEKEIINKIMKQIHLIIQEISRLKNEINIKSEEIKKQKNENIDYKKQNKKLKKEIIYYQKSIKEIKERIEEMLNARLLYKESQQCNTIKEELEQLEKELNTTFISKSDDN